MAKLIALTMKKTGFTSMFEDKTGKKSPKRILGSVGFSLSLVAFVLSGMHFYEIDSTLILGVMGITAGMLSVGGLTKEG